MVGVTRNDDRWETEDHLQELALLTDTAGADVIDKVIQEKARIDPAYFVSRGKAEIICDLVKERQANLLIFDDDLSPAQVRNLEKLTGQKILDRSGLILDIFAHRAKTKEAKTQVELAQLNYLLPRLTRQWTHLSRQVGGIGTRGPGETQLEVDRRLVRKRISVLTKALRKITNQREVRRQGRQETYKAALVGYTNAGKSTLMNSLTQSEVFVEDRLFATLDPTIRRMKIPNFKEVLLIDTVGFIRKLPHNLVASFKSTLEEAAVADLLLHVVDITHPGFFQHIQVVNDVLNDLKISNKPTILVFNKIDRLKNKAIVQRLKNEYPQAVFVSATRGLFLTDLSNEICRAASESVVELELGINVEYSEIIARIYELSEVVQTDYREKRVAMRVKATEEDASAVERLLEREIPGHYSFERLDGI
ncbi:MAG: GTPase HflX [bacterium]